MQLADYTSPGVFAASGVAGYFSLDGGVTNLGEFSPADTSDWANGGANDAFDAAVAPATALSITPKDLEFLSWLGFDNTSAAPAPPTPPVPPVITPPTPPVIIPPAPPTPPAPPHPPTPPTPPVAPPHPPAPPPPSPPTPPKAATNNFAVTDQSTGKSWQSPGTRYSGPVAGLTSEFIAVTPDNLNITATAPNTFISLDGGSGEDAIAVSHANGNNVLNGSTGSSFLYGGTGNDTFFVDDRNPPAGSSIWSTVVGFHSGDAATVWGVTASDFNLSWVNGQGAANFTGLTLHATSPGLPVASLTLAGLTSADLTNGKLSISFGRTQDLPGLSGSNYMQIHAN